MSMYKASWIAIRVEYVKQSPFIGVFAAALSVISLDLSVVILFKVLIIPHLVLI